MGLLNDIIYFLVCRGIYFVALNCLRKDREPGLEIDAPREYFHKE